MNKPIIILGGGPTGLAAAYRLAQKRKKFIILEKENYLGGLSATLKYQNLLYELGPHAFHLKNQKMIHWTKKILGKNFRVIPTNTKVFINNNIFNYPLSAGELIRKTNPFLGLKIIVEYLTAYIKNIFRQQKIISFQDWGLVNFGPTLYRLSFGDYTKKVWGMDPAKISASLATNKLSRLNLGDIFLKLLGFRGKNQPAYFKKYLYPKKGTSFIFNLMLDKIKKYGQVQLSSKVTALKSNNNEIYAVEFENDQNKKNTIECSSVISTLTLKDTIPIINAPLNRQIIETSQKLNYRGLIIVYLIVESKLLPNYQWIYLAENKFRCNRITINKNLSPDFINNHQTILACEISANPNDHLWQSSDVKLFKMMQSDLAQLGFENLKITHYFSKRIENAYPIYRVGYEKKLNEILSNLGQINNLICAGRNGLFLNSDISDCFQMGFEAADFIQKDNFHSEKWYEKKLKQP